MTSTRGRRRPWRSSGAGGGEAGLSGYGKVLLGEYRLIEEEVQRSLRRLNTEINLGFFSAGAISSMR
jgi:molybdenum-dependent DNA-binding transcriptional regulator ModE